MKHHTISEMQDIASTRGGRCLSNVFINVNTKLEWECSNGHRWFAQPRAVLFGTWCKKCFQSKIRKNGITTSKNEIQNEVFLIIQEKHGILLNTFTYQGNKSRIYLQCSNGHQWETTAGRILSGRWCLKCNSTKTIGIYKHTIEDMQKFAQSKNGKCLSTIYRGRSKKLLWECEKGHQWEALPYKRWCPICGGSSPIGFERIQQITMNKGGKCLSKSYKNDITNMQFECEKGHYFEITYQSIRDGHWCPYCNGYHHIDEMKEIAKNRGGKCLSKEYDANNQMMWQCAKGHIWKTQARIIIAGYWCPSCHSYYGESLCRWLFEQIFKCKFIKRRYKWLLSPIGYQMELDGYNSSLKLAFEYQGKQHYEFVEDFHHTEDGMKERNDRDQRKREICHQKGIILIEIPYTVKFGDMQDYIIKSYNKIARKRLRNITKYNLKDYNIYTKQSKISMSKQGLLAFL